MASQRRRRRPGRPRGRAPTQSHPNAFEKALSLALSKAGPFSRAGGDRSAIAWLGGALLASEDARGRAYVAVPARDGIDGRARGITRRQRRRKPDEWLAASRGELVAWLACRKRSGEANACNAAAAMALGRIDRRWPQILDKLDRAIDEVTPTAMQPFELSRLPPAFTELLRALRKRRGD